LDIENHGLVADGTVPVSLHSASESNDTPTDDRWSVLILHVIRHGLMSQVTVVVSEH
jgi:hypothetical protein